VGQSMQRAGVRDKVNCRWCDESKCSLVGTVRHVRHYKRDATEAQQAHAVALILQHSMAGVFRVCALSHALMPSPLPPPSYGRHPFATAQHISTHQKRQRTDAPKNHTRKRSREHRAVGHVRMQAHHAISAPTGHATRTPSRPWRSRAPFAFYLANTPRTLPPLALPKTRTG